MRLLKIALILTPSIKNSIERAQNAYEIARLQAQIGSQQAQQTLNLALTFSEFIEEMNPKARILVNIAEAQAKENQVKAEQILQLARDAAKSINLHNTLILNKIAGVKVQMSHIQQAQQILSLALFTAQHYIENRTHRFEILCEIVKVQAQINIGQACTIAESIQSVRYKAKALCEIATVQARTNIEQAFVIAQSIQNVFYKSKAIGAILEAVSYYQRADYPLDLAIMVAQSIEDNYERALILYKIAELELKFNPAQASKIVRLTLLTAFFIQDEYYRAAILYRVAKVQIGLDIQQAQQTLDLAVKIIQPAQAYYKAHTLVQIAKVQAQMNSEKAEQILQVAFVAAQSIHTIGNDSDQSEALCEIVKVQAKINIQQAFFINRSIQQRSYKAKALIEIAYAQIETDSKKAHQLFIELLKFPLEEKEKVALILESISSFLKT